MKPAEIETYRERLLKMAARLNGDLTELRQTTLRGVGGEAGGGLSNLPTHPADLGTETSVEEVDLGLLGNQEHLLTEVDAALGRIRVGTFGRCENCGKEIPTGRLEALPQARYCLACTEKAEMRSLR